MEFSIQTRKRIELLDITEKVRSLIEGKIKEGICLVYAPHATAAIIINEYEPLLESDFLKLFEKLVPPGNYAHNSIDDNAEAHLKSGIIGSGREIPIENGRLALGTWQRIIFCEFDGPRSRRVIVQVR